MNFSFCIRKLAVVFYMINEIQPKIKFQNIVQCPFNISAQKSRKIINWVGNLQFLSAVIIINWVGNLQFLSAVIQVKYFFLGHFEICRPFNAIIH